MPFFLLALTLLLPQRALAFCGFYVSGASADLYNNASMVVLAREGTRTVVTMQNNYQGPAEDFALVIPVPQVLQEKNVHTVPRELFSKIDTLSAPRLVEYWEQNPCPNPEITREFLERIPTGRDYQSVVSMAPGVLRRPAVKVEAEFDVAEYQIVVLSARNSGALEAWLREHRYNIPAGAAGVLAPYVASGTKFFVAKVNLEKVAYNDGRALLTPLRFYYDSDTFSLPVRLGLLNSSGEQDLIVTVLATDRYDVANYNNAFIPTNIRVKDAARTSFGLLYNGLFQRAAGTDGRTVVTEYAWSSAGCDPCPGPALVPDDVAKLGGDVLGWTPSTSTVLTRLHYRYTSKNLGQDLVFREAEPVLGGRGVPDTSGQLSERQPTPSSVNQFQGRYVILHPWAGEVACESPRRGVWGGPQGGSARASVAPSAVRGGSTALVSNRELLDVLDEDLPGLPPEGPPGGCSTSPATGGIAGMVALFALALRRRSAGSQARVFMISLTHIRCMYTTYVSKDGAMTPSLPLPASSSVPSPSLALAAPARMKAVLQAAYGGPEVLQITEAAAPTLTPDGVLVAVAVAAVTRGDWHLVTGTPYLIRAPYGLSQPSRPIPGMAMTGTVVAVGASVTGFRVGDRVFAELNRGGFAEYVNVPAKDLALIPQGLSFEDAATIPVSGTTALQALRDGGRVQPGQSVLVNGASGGVGVFAVQLARAMGATVTAVCSASNAAMVSALGAHRVIDYRAEDFTQGSERYDVILDLVGNHSLSALRGALTPKGRLLAASGGAEHTVVGPMLNVLGGLISNLWSAQPFVPVMNKPDPRDLVEIAQRLLAGEVKPVIDRRYTLDEVPEAVRYLGTGRTRGKSIVTL